MKKYILILIFIGFEKTFAQTSTNSLSLTLKQAIATAEVNNVDLSKSKKDVAISHETVLKTIDCCITWYSIRNFVSKFDFSISFIRIDKVIQNNQSAIEFNLTEKATTFRDGVERTLDKTDFFQALGLGVFLCVENKSKPGSGQLLTYPNPDQIG